MHKLQRSRVFMVKSIDRHRRFKPGRDINSLEALLDRLSLRLDLPRGARHIFSMDGDRKISLDELEDGASYVVSSYKTFKVSLTCVCVCGWLMCVHTFFEGFARTIVCSDQLGQWKLVVAQQSLFDI